MVSLSNHEVGLVEARCHASWFDGLTMRLLMGWLAVRTSS